MENITGKRSDPVRKIINIAQKTSQHCYTKFGKVTQKCLIQVPKKPRKIEIGICNFAQRLEVSQIDSKKISTSRTVGKWVFWNPCFKIDCYDIKDLARSPQIV